MEHKKGILTFITISYTILLTIGSLLSGKGTPLINIKHFDKIVHFSAYALLCFLWYLVFKSAKRKHSIRFAVVISFVFGIVLEILQGKLTTSREASIMDIVANTLGIGVVSLILTRRNKTIVKKI